MSENIKCTKMMKLYAVTDRAWTERMSLIQQIETALKGGITCLQLREKELDFDSFLSEAIEVKKLCDKYNVPLIINDNIEIAIKCDADGIHAGQKDMSADKIRNIIGKNKILGISASTVQQAVNAQKAGADYIGTGAVFTTATKQNTVPVSFDVLSQICSSVSIPVTAIGGITEKNIYRLSGSGIDGVAVVSAIFGADDIESACRRLLTMSASVTDKGKSKL